MKLPRWLKRFGNNLGALLATAGSHGWMRTLDYQAAYYDRAIDPVFPECRSQGIYIFWHENILFPLYLRGRYHLTMLLSQHRDADMLSRVAFHMGFDWFAARRIAGRSARCDRWSAKAVNSI